MKNGRWQAKDIDDRVYLRHVYEQQRNPSPPSCMLSVRGYWLASPWPADRLHWVHLDVVEACLPLFPSALIRAKAGALIRRGLLTGCACGCRGDLELTDEGAAFLGVAP